MYSISQVAQGLNEPVLARCEIEKKLQNFTGLFPHDIGVQGSYWTTNIGDKAIGEILASRLRKQGFDTKLFSKDIDLCNASVRILGGGGIIHDFYPDHLSRRLKFLGEGGALIGVGVPGVKSSSARDLLRRKLADTSLITVRDSRSYERLQTYCNRQVHVTACPALLHDDPECSTSGRTGVNFVPTSFYDHSPEAMNFYFDYSEKLDTESAKSRYIKNINSLCDEIDEPVYIPLHINDERFARDYMDIEVLPYKFSVEETLKRISSMERMITTRYHSLVFSIVCDKPVLVIDYNPKVSSLAERIKVSSYTPHRNIPLEFEHVSNRSKVRQSAERNFDLLDEYLFQDRL